MTIYLILNQFTSPCLFLSIWKCPAPRWVCKMRNWKLSLICDSSMKFWGDWGLSLQSVHTRQGPYHWATFSVQFNESLIPTLYKGKWSLACFRKRNSEQSWALKILWHFRSFQEAGKLRPYLEGAIWVDMGLWHESLLPSLQPKF